MQEDLGGENSISADSAKLLGLSQPAEPWTLTADKKTEDEAARVQKK